MEVSESLLNGMVKQPPLLPTLFSRIVAGFWN